MTHQASPHQRFRQDRHRRIRARAAAPRRGILSTGGTAKLLEDAGLTVTEVADYTGFPEMLDGRVKTLHPKSTAASWRDATSRAHGGDGKAAIPTIDLVVVNLYPFSQTVARPDCTLEDAIENIDIGGPAMVRAAAKNHKNVAVVTDPADYARCSPR